MFSKRSVRPTLVETYEEAEKVEVELESIEHYPTQSNERIYGNKKPLLQPNLRMSDDRNWKGW